MSDTQTAIILVTDLVDSTAHRSQVGEEAAETLRRRHDALLSEAITTNDGLVVKHLGDGALARFSGAADAVAAAVSIQQSVDGEFDVRVGISAGDVTIEDDDVFGTPVIEASRLCAHAEGGQILVADLARMLARGRGGHAFDPIGELELKGLPDPVTASQVQWAPVADDQQRVPYPVALDSSTAFPYAGRIGPLDAVTQAWKQSVEGIGGVVLISGEPGMGKTRLSTEAARRAFDEHGAIVLFGRADEEITSPYRPFTEALGHLINHVPADVLDAHVDEFAGSLASVSSALTQRRPDVVPLDGSADEVRTAVFDATLDLLDRAGRAAPVMLILDDLHWADDASLLLLRHLGRSLGTQRLLVVGTYRDTDLVRGHQLSSVLADLRRVERVERIDLEGLDEAEVSELLAVAGGHDLDERGAELARIVHTETEGNPFFVGEILRYLAESGAIYESDGRWVTDAESVSDLGVPQGIREVVGRRLDALADDANAALRTAAVIGQDFDLRVLARALDRHEDELIDLLDDALGRNLLAEAPGEIDRLRFPHALVRQTLYEELSASRRVRIHARIADALASMPRSEAAQLAHHRLEAAAVTDLALVADAAEAAAAEALQTSAWETALDWIERALEAADDQGDDGTVRARLLVARSRARATGGHQMSEARADLIEAASVARAAGDDQVLIDAAISYAQAGSAWLSLDDTVGLELVREAEGLLPEAESEHGGLLSIARAELMLLSPDRAAVEEPARRGLDIIRRTAPEHLGVAINTMCEALRGSADPAELYEAAHEARSLDHSMFSLYGLYFEALARLGQGDLTSFGLLADEIIDVASRRRHRVLSWCGYQARANLHVLRGRFDDADEDYDTALGFADSFGDTGFSVIAWGRIHVAGLRRDLVATRREADELTSRFPALEMGAARLLSAQLEGEASGADLSGPAVAWEADVLPTVPFTMRSSIVHRLAPSFRHAPPEVIARVARELDGYDDVWPGGGLQDTSGHYGWGMACLAEGLGDLDAAVAHHETAFAAHVDAGEVSLRANWSRYLVTALLARDRPGDRARAREVAHDAAEIADRIGIIGLADQVTGLID